MKGISSLKSVQCLNIDISWFDKTPIFIDVDLTIDAVYFKDSCDRFVLLSGDYKNIHVKSVWVICIS